MKAIGCLVLAAAASVSLVFIQVLKPSSVGAAVFAGAWLLLPYVALAVMLLFFSKERTSVIACVVVAVVVAVGGLLFLTDIIFLRPDPQGGIAVLFTPIYQAVGIAVLLPTCQWLWGRMRT